MCFIVGVDDTIVYLFDELLEHLDCKPGLIDKPKMFFVNPNSDSVFISDKSEQMTIFSNVPADTLVHYGLVRNSMEWRTLQGESVYVQCLCDMLDEYAVKKNFELTRLLRILNNKVFHDHKLELISVFRSEKCFYFKPNDAPSREEEKKLPLEK
jgi:hypothetical protein